jgi:hypothetical protein
MVEVAKVMKWFAILTILKASVTFAMKNWKFCWSWSKNVEFGYVGPENFFDNAYVSPEKCFWLCLC